MKVALYGAGGRMGCAIARLIAAADDSEIVGAVDHHDAPTIGRDIGELAGLGTLGVEVSPDVASALLGADVVIDFTVASAFDACARAAMKAGVALVSGTTRLSEDSRALIDKAAEKIPVLWAPNMSLGVQVLGQLVEQAARALGDYDIEIVEAHHNRKVDAPSGTATFLLDRARAARPDSPAIHGREGDVGGRPRGEIAVHALRGGGIVGDHTVHLIGEYDRIEITHRAMRRELFAEGAVRAARFVAGRAAGRYSLSDTLDSSARAASS